MTHIKFCGMTRAEDVAAAIDLGVNAVGFVLWPGSPRHVDAVAAARLVRMLPPDITPVGVFVRPSDAEVERALSEIGIRVAQVHARSDVGRIAGGEVWIAASLDDVPDGVRGQGLIVLDAHDPVRHGGTGRTIDWTRAAAVAAARRVILAGGLTAVNVGDAIRCVRPFGVDVASGIEDAPGVKNPAAMRAFVAAVHQAQP
jgi:phosphoribosylanthranilate isomerase